MHFWINLHLLGVQNYCIILLFNSQKFSDFLCDSLTHELLRLLNISFFFFFAFQLFHCSQTLWFACYCFFNFNWKLLCVLAGIWSFFPHYVWNGTYSLIVGCRILSISSISCISTYIQSLARSCYCIVCIFYILQILCCLIYQFQSDMC